jgi:predicted metalloprotease with PDZ domain
LNLSVLVHAGLASRARDLAARTEDIVRFYRWITGDSPYSSLTFALIEGPQPGGHSPGYFAVLSQPPLSQPRTWRNDPAAFDRHPDFFPAHEIAHQWWGQAVGWDTYHDQWLSEGFAQYFAALYVGHQRGDETFRTIMGELRRWALRESDQGPIYLGYRLGHVRSDSRVFRALVYDKGAAVLHMLRRLVGDESFFSGIRRFYADWRFRKAGTEDFRLAMEAASGRSLRRFFENWIYGSALPQLKFTYRVQNDTAAGRGREIILRIDQTGELFDVPVTVQLQFADRPTVEVNMAVADRTTELRVPLSGTFRRAEISRTDGTLADVQTN